MKLTGAAKSTLSCWRLLFSMYVLNCCSRPMRLCICMHLRIFSRLASMTLPCQQAVVEDRPPVIRSSKVARAGKVGTVSQAQALDYDYIAPCSTQWCLHEVTPSYRALRLFQVATCVQQRCRFWFAAKGHSFYTRMCEVEAMAKS